MGEYFRVVIERQKWDGEEMKCLDREALDFAEGTDVRQSHAVYQFMVQSITEAMGIWDMMMKELNKWRKEGRAKNN